MMDKKKCRSCIKLKSLKEFYKAKAFKDGYMARCKDCYNSWRRKNWSEASGEKKKARNIRKRKGALKYRYGLSLEDYERMAREQGGVCKICGSLPEGKGCAGLLHVDHHHETKNVRGLLCLHCNQMIGYFGEDIPLMKKAADYLYSHQKGLRNN